MKNFFILHPVFYFSITAIVGFIASYFLNRVTFQLPILLKNNWQIECRNFLNLTSEVTLEKFNFFTHTYNDSSVNNKNYLFRVFCTFFSIVIAWRYGITWQTGMMLLLTWGLLVLTFIDIEHQLLPDIIIFPLLWLGLLISIIPLFVTSADAIVGAAFGYLSLWILAKIFERVTGKIGMGHGDFKLCAMLGAWLGWKCLPFVLLISSITGTVIGLSWVLIKKQNFDTPLPFGPYLAFAGMVMLLR